MSKKPEHHDLSLKLLAGKSIPNGSPWSPTEERYLISQERLLWDALTEDEQKEEQLFLTHLWANRGAVRHIPVNPEWGDWAKELGSTIEVPDTAFGIPSQDFRPYAKGTPLDIPREFERLSIWLWDRGFQIVAVEHHTLTLSIPNHRVVQEADRLLTLLVQAFPEVKITPHGSREGAQLRSVYDPVGGHAAIELSWIADWIFNEEENHG